MGACIRSQVTLLETALVVSPVANDEISPMFSLLSDDSTPGGLSSITAADNLPTREPPTPIGDRNLLDGWL